MNGTVESISNAIPDASIKLNHFKLGKWYFNYSSMQYKNLPSDTDILHKVYTSGNPLIPVKCPFANFESDANPRRLGKAGERVNVFQLCRDS